MAKERLTDFEMEYLERRAQGRAAWGAYAAIVRQTNFNKQLAACKTDEERERLIKDGEEQNSRGFWIG